jgi:hypothetical protein
LKNFSFTKHFLPHALACAVFIAVTLVFFSPIFFDGKTVRQHDIQQFQGSAKEIIDYRKQTGGEALWTNSMFSGMPAYLISTQWSAQPITYIKKILTAGFPSPVANILAAFVSFYILLLAFGVRPYLAIGGAIAFGLSTYMIIGLSAGHNARIGAIAFMPLVVAGVRLVFRNRIWLGMGVTSAGLALHLRENHLQITYYLLIILLVYASIEAWQALREKTIKKFIVNGLLLSGAALLAAATFFGPLWSVQEYTKYSIRGKSELTAHIKKDASNSKALSRDYAFQYSNGIFEPMTLLIPNIYGGSSMQYLFQNEKSETYKALIQSGNQEQANQLAAYTGAYWGSQPLTMPYYAGAIICFLFALGLVVADKKLVVWLSGVALLGIVLSWGSNFESFNYFLFDYLPGYNKFRSVTFAMLFPIFSFCLLGSLALEHIVEGNFQSLKKKLIWPAGIVLGICLLFALTGGMGSFLRDGEAQLPTWLMRAMQADRKDLLQSDAWRAFWFILVTGGVLAALLKKWISPVIAYVAIPLLMVIDLTGVNKRYFTAENFQRKRDNTFFAPTAADEAILKDKSYYRVYNLQDAMSEARTSYFHHSVGGYHGAKIRRYQDFVDSCLYKQTSDLITNFQSGNTSFQNYGAINMLNAKYLVYGPGAENILVNNAAYGPAWFVKEIKKVKSADEELSALNATDVGTTAIIDETKFAINNFGYDSMATVKLQDYSPKKLVYEVETAQNGLVVFSEIYYPEGWKAFIDGKEVNILRANYILRALDVPAGKHKIEFRFEPASYHIGNSVTAASSWIVLLFLISCIVLEIRKKNVG